MGGIGLTIGFQHWAVIPYVHWCSGLQQLMTDSFLKHFNFSFCSIWSRSIWLQLFQVTCSSFWWNSPWIISLALLQIHADRTPSHANSNDKVSCASPLDAIGKALAHTKSVAYTCEHLLPLLDTALQASCLRTQDVLGSDNKNFYHSFWIVSITKDGA